MKKMKLILNESLISNKDSDIIEDTTVAQKPDYQIIDITVIPDETYYPTIQSILIDLDENDKLKESENSKLDINILSETVNQKTGYSNSLFEFESSKHTITLSLVLQETDRRGIYKVEAYTTKGIKVFESNTYRPKYVVESYLNSLANEYLIDKPLKESGLKVGDEIEFYSTGYKPNGKFSNKPNVLMKTTITKVNPDGSVSAKDPQGAKSFDYITPEEIISVNGKKIKESAPYYIGPNEYAMVKPNDEDSDVLCMYLDDNCYDEEVIPKNWSEDKIRMLAGKISKSEGPRGNRDFIGEVEKEYTDNKLKESVRVYDDEKDYSSELSEVYNIVADFINDRFYNDNDIFLEYSDPNNYHNRVDHTKVFNGIAQKLNGAGYGVNTDAKHYAGIGNNNAYELFNKNSECIGVLNINSSLYSEVYVYLERLNGEPYGGTWELRPASSDNLQRKRVVIYKEAEEVEDSSVYKLTISKDENSGPQTVKKFNTREAAEKEEEFFKSSGLYTRIDEEKITCSKEDIQKRIDEIENEIQKKVKRYSSAQKQYHGDNSLSDRLEGEVDSLEQEQKRLRALLGEAEDPIKDDVKEDLGIEPGSDEEATLDEIYEEPEDDKYYGATDNKLEVEKKDAPTDYSTEEFMTALRLADKVYDLNIDYSDWNDMDQKQREDLVTPEIKRFLNMHKAEFDKSPNVFDLLQYNLTDANFHTEAKVLRDLYRGGE